VKLRQRIGIITVLQCIVWSCWFQISIVEDTSVANQCFHRSISLDGGKAVLFSESEKNNLI